MKLLLIRHGQTEANARRLYCGATDVSLSADGRAQLAALRASGVYPDAEAFYKLTSGMRRTNETLACLFGCAPEGEDARLREMNFGRFEMHSYAELKDDADYQAWIADSAGSCRTPGGESAEDFRRRVLAAADELHRDTLLVTHGGVIAALMRHWFPDAGKNLYQWQPRGGCGYLVEAEGAHAAYRPIPDLKA